MLFSMRDSQQRQAVKMTWWLVSGRSIATCKPRLRPGPGGQIFGDPNEYLVMGWWRAELASLQAGRSLGASGGPSSHMIRVVGKPEACQTDIINRGVVVRGEDHVSTPRALYRVLA